MTRPIMKTLLLLLVTAITSSAQNYSIPWSKIAGGRGVSADGVFAVNGTVGQHDAGGPSTNTIYILTGGFWVLPIAVPTLSTPILSIAPGTLGQAVISWTPATPGFVLQEASSLAPSNWVNSASGASNPVLVPAGVPAKFYRLHKP